MCRHTETVDHFLCPVAFRSWYKLKDSTATPRARIGDCAVPGCSVEIANTVNHQSGRWVCPIVTSFEVVNDTLSPDVVRVGLEPEDSAASSEARGTGSISRCAIQVPGRIENKVP